MQHCPSKLCMNLLPHLLPQTSPRELPQEDRLSLLQVNRLLLLQVIRPLSRQLHLHLGLLLLLLLLLLPCLQVLYKLKYLVKEMLFPNWFRPSRRSSL